MTFFGELKRRNVFRVGAAYIVTTWLIIQVVETLFPIYGLTDAAVRLVISVLAIGLVPALVLAWVFEWTPEGVKKDKDTDHPRPASPRAARRLDRMILVALAIAITYFTFDKFVLDPAHDAQNLATAVEEAREEGRAAAREETRDSSIAVLAFQDLSPSGNQAYFGDGLAIDLINQLGEAPDLRVTGKTSAFSFKGKDSTITQIGEALNVAHILDGSISKIGDRVRISVELVDARHDEQLWSHTYDRALGDIFDIRDEITLRVYDQLTIEFERLKQERIRTDPQVYDLTLQARYLYEHAKTGDEYQQASELLTQALAIDPDYVPVLLLLPYVNYWLLESGLMSDEKNTRLSMASIERALAVDPNNGTALGLVAWIAWETRFDLEVAAQRISVALRTAPGDLELTRIAGMFARAVGRHDESIALLERCVAADPFNTSCGFHLAQSYLWGNRLEDALKAHRSLASLTGKRGALYYEILILLLQGEAELALAEFESVVTPAGRDHPQMLAARAMIMHDLGKHEESASAFDKIRAQLSGQYRDEAYLLAEAYAWIGDINRAFEWLEKAYVFDERYGLHGFWFNRIMYLPIWRKLYGDPRWDDFGERANLSEARMQKLEFSVPEWIWYLGSE